MQHKTYSKQRKPNSALRNRTARRSRAWWRTGRIWRRSTRTCGWPIPRRHNPSSSGWRLASRSVQPSIHPSIRVWRTHFPHHHCHCLCLYLYLYPYSISLCLCSHHISLSLTRTEPPLLTAWTWSPTPSSWIHLCIYLYLSALWLCKRYVSASECVCMSASVLGGFTRQRISIIN